MPSRSAVRRDGLRAAVLRKFAALEKLQELQLEETTELLQGFGSGSASSHCPVVEFGQVVATEVLVAVSVKLVNSCRK